MIYRVTQTINSSTRLYAATTHQSSTGFQRFYNIERWTVMPAGEHFAALAQPQALVEDIRAFFRPLRDRRQDTGQAG
jgi:hypothetical protein